MMYQPVINLLLVLAVTVGVIWIIIALIRKYMRGGRS